MTVDLLISLDQAFTVKYVMTILEFDNVRVILLVFENPCKNLQVTTFIEVLKS